MMANLLSFEDGGASMESVPAGFFKGLIRVY